MTSTPPPSIPTFTMDFLCKLIPKEFNGNRHELGQFIANCNNAHELAADQQKIPLIYFILSRISGRAKEQLAQQSFKTWEELKNKLKILYQDKKHYVQIMEELNNCKQNFNENISDYFQRLEILNSRALSAAQQYTMLRWKEFENLNSAYTAALAEERALSINKTKFCRNCKRNNHNTSDCRINQKPFKSINTIQNINPQSQSNSNSNNNYQNKFCNYCKKSGHLINECRKRKYNNEKKAQNSGNHLQTQQ
ncbi:hypothetical protein PV325_007991, partial [Microctonus aethiopoides]